MNRAFWRPFLLIFCTVLILGILAWFIPACENKTLPIKKLNWFESIFTRNNKSLDVELAKHADSLHIESELTPLERFRDELKRSGHSGNVRIAYFGDSIIEGDLLTGKLRQLFQSSQGGNGIGFMPITSVSAGFRNTINHSFSRNWESISFMTSGRNDISLGISGFTFIPRGYYIVEKAIETEIDTLAFADSTIVETPPKKQNQRHYVNSNPWVSYSAVDALGGCKNFARIRLFYSQASDSSFVIASYDGGEPVKRSLRRGDGLQVLDLSPDTPVKSIRLEFSAYDPIHVYGVSLDQKSGVYVDSFTIRGYSGMYFQRIFEQTISEFQRSLDYDLVILHYGVNVSNQNTRDYGYYKRGMIRTLEHLKKGFPDIPIMLVSAHDRSIKLQGSYRTSPDIPILVNTQGEIALETGSAFWNLFQAMGGYNSMVKYVNSNPPLAQKDHTHFNRTGANYIAEMLYNTIMGIDEIPPLPQ